uniref:(northern house mosquito) hypothetical protein n=1 Tax=Culex pipiens TaxID=7175 RepID=A0A8D8CGZ0_CULPI
MYVTPSSLRECPELRRFRRKSGYEWPQPVRSLSAPAPTLLPRRLNRTLADLRCGVQNCPAAPRDSPSTTTFSGEVPPAESVAYAFWGWKQPSGHRCLRRSSLKSYPPRFG